MTVKQRVSWITSDFSGFYFDKEADTKLSVPHYLYACEFHNISWDMHTIKSRCSYCKTIANDIDATCQQCGGNETELIYSMQDAEFTIIGRMPHAEDMLFIREGGQVHICHNGKARRADDYDDMIPVIIAKNCKPQDKYIPLLGANTPDDISAVDMWMVVKADIEIMISPDDFFVEVAERS